MEFIAICSIAGLLGGATRALLSRESAIMNVRANSAMGIAINSLIGLIGGVFAAYSIGVASGSTIALSFITGYVLSDIVCSILNIIRPSKRAKNTRSNNTRSNHKQSNHKQSNHKRASTKSKRRK